MGMDSLNDMFFTSTASESLSYDQILEDVQKYCTEKHSDKLSTEDNQEEARKLLREFIFQYVISRSYRMEGMKILPLTSTRIFCWNGSSENIRMSSVSGKCAPPRKPYP